MGFLKVQNLVKPKSSVIEAVGYTVLPDERTAEIIYVQTNFGKVYEYTAYDGDGKDYSSEFVKIAHGESAGSAWHAFKKNNRPSNVLDAGNGQIWGLYELQLEVNEPVEVETPVNEEYLEANGEQFGSQLLDSIGFVTRDVALGVALTLAEIQNNGNIDDLLANSDKVYEYLNKS